MDTGRLLKNLSESSDRAQDERSRIDIIDDFPFMLRLSKHSKPFFSNLLETRRDCLYI
jgi:hypothetical protein